jgi:hypothetical protein
LSDNSTTLLNKYKAVVNELDDEKLVFSKSLRIQTRTNLEKSKETLTLFVGNNDFNVSAANDDPITIK